MKRLVFALVSVFFVLATILTVSYAWFINSDLEDPDVSGYSYAAYFASGNGSKENPYTITNKRHLYNLAWLQYLGKWNEFKTSTVDGKEVKTLTNQYYFQISPTVKELDMSNYPLPPIGTEENPFIGVFNGNGCIIKNLTVSNDISEFGTNLPKADEVNKTNIEELNIIGMFGVVGNYNSMYNISSYVPSIQNFYIDNVTISSIATNSLVGLVAGYVGPSGNIKYVGVHYSKFNLASGVTKIDTFKKISNYALIGDFDSANIGWEEKPSGSGTGQGEGADYGGNFNVNRLLQRLQLIAKNIYQFEEGTELANIGKDTVLKDNTGAAITNTTYSTLLPAVDILTNTYPVPARGSKLPLTVKTITDESGNVTLDTSMYEGTKAIEEVSSQNIGYYIGSENKITQKTINFGENLTLDSNGNYVDSSGTTPATTGDTPKQFFKILQGKEDFSNSVITPLTNEETKNLPQGIKDIIGLKSDGTYSDMKKSTHTAIRLSIRYSGNVQTTTQYQSDTFSPLGQISYKGKTYGTTPQLYTDGGVYLPNNGIWFKPQKAGTLRFVLFTGEDGNSCRIIKVTRNQASADNPFPNSNDFSSKEISATNGKGNNNFPNNILIYFEHKITEEEIEKGQTEYVILKGDSDGAYFLYLDIGISGGGTEDGGTTEDQYSGKLSSIDFVYSVTSSDGTTILSDITLSTYSKSDVVFVLDGESLGVVVAFKRIVDENNSKNTVYYYVTSEKGVTVSPVEDTTGASTSTTNENCNS